jgi:hypothetical protein
MKLNRKPKNAEVIVNGTPLSLALGEDYNPLI